MTEVPVAGGYLAHVSYFLKKMKFLFGLKNYSRTFRSPAVGVKISMQTLISLQKIASL